MSYRPRSQYWYTSLLADATNAFSRYVNSEKVIALMVSAVPASSPTVYSIEVVAEGITDRLALQSTSSGFSTWGDGYLALQRFLKDGDGIDA